MGLLVYVIDIECKPFGFEVLCKKNSKKRFCFVRAETEFKIKETSNKLCTLVMFCLILASNMR